MSLNSVAIAGRLTADPISKTVGNEGVAVCQFTLAVDKRGKDAGTNFIDCVAWRGAAETISKYVEKGQMFGVIGHLDQQTWEKDGKKGSKIQVVVDEFTFLSPKGESGNSQTDKESDTITLDDIPF